MKKKDLILKDEYSDGDGNIKQVYEFETPNLYFSFEMDKKTKIVDTYSWRNSEGEGMDDLGLPVEALAPIIKDLDF